MAQFKGSGGTTGGTGEYIFGFLLAAVAVYLFFDSVRMTAGNLGWMSGFMRRGTGGLMGETTSMAIVFLPFGIGVWAMFVNSTWRWAQALTIGGLALIAVEILSRVRFTLNMKTSYFLMLIVLFAIGTALMFRSYLEHQSANKGAEKP